MYLKRRKEKREQDMSGEQGRLISLGRTGGNVLKGDNETQLSRPGRTGMRT